MPALVLVSTPIGNLKDMSIRAREALAAADIVLCEDTRTSQTLLHAYGIEARCEPLHEHNETAAIPRLIQAMQAGKRYALISDAGTPLLSDPGYRLTRAAIDAGLAVSGVPGPSAVTLALTLSGLPPHPFLFLGFLPPRSGPRIAALRGLRAAEAAGLAASIVCYEAPHRLAAALAEAAAELGPRPAAVCRELTKRFEEIRRGSLAELSHYYAANPARGEITLVIGAGSAPPPSEAALTEALASALQNMSLKDAVETVSRATGQPRRQVYARALAMTRAPGGDS